MTWHFLPPPQTVLFLGAKNMVGLPKVHNDIGLSPVPIPGERLDTQLMQAVLVYYMCIYGT